MAGMHGKSMVQVRTAQLALPGLPDPPAETLVAVRVMSRALAASAPEHARLTLARSFASSVVRAFWQAITSTDAKATPIRDPLHDFATEKLPAAAHALAESVGRAAAELGPEAAVYAIGLTYTGMLPGELRAARGIYYTPPPLAARLIGQATEAGTNWATARVLDPACGGGAFLAPAAQRIMDALQGSNPRIVMQAIAARLRGYELDPFGAWLSQVSLDAAVLPLSRATGQRLPTLVAVCDALGRDLSPEPFDLVIGNPPYARVTLAPADRARFRRSLYGHANLYGLFTDLALRHTKPGGIVAYVTPTSFLAGEYFKNLRALLGYEAPPATIDFVSTRKGVFEDVLQETLLATYRRQARRAAVTVHEIAPANGSRLTTAAVGKISLPADPSRPWLLPRSALEAPLVARLAATPHRLSDWGYAVSTGPLVWNRHKQQLAQSPGRNRHPLIWAEAVTADGRFIHRAEKRNHAPYFELRRGDEWLILDRPCVLVQRTTAKEQTRRLIAAALPQEFLARHGAVVVENHLNMLLPLLARPPVAANLLAAFLNSAASDRAFRSISGSVAVSAYELEALPLPSPDALEELHTLVRKGASQQSMEDACARLYGLRR